MSASKCSPFDLTAVSLRARLGPHAWDKYQTDWQSPLVNQTSKHWHNGCKHPLNVNSPRYEATPEYRRLMRHREEIVGDKFFSICVSSTKVHTVQFLSEYFPHSLIILLDFKLNPPPLLYIGLTHQFTSPFWFVFPTGLLYIDFCLVQLPS